MPLEGRKVLVTEKRYNKIGYCGDYVYEGYFIAFAEDYEKAVIEKLDGRIRKVDCYCIEFLDRKNE